jgi:regulatory protein
VRITEIKETRRGRFALFGPEGFLFSLDAETLAQNEINEGSSLRDEELLLLKAQSDTRKAKDQALRYLALRAYGERELYEKLLLKYDGHSAAAAVAAMCGLGLLCDEEFAREKAMGMAGRGKSPRAILQKLTALGIAPLCAKGAVDALEIDGEEAAMGVIYKVYSGALCRGERQKVMAALARRGFSHGEIVCAVKRAETELGAAAAAMREGEEP